MSQKTEAENVCERLCALFENPDNWAFDTQGLLYRLRPIYEQARSVIRPRDQPQTARELLRHIDVEYQNKRLELPVELHAMIVNMLGPSQTDK